MNVAVVYHFFPHYRVGIIKELLASNRHRYVFYGDLRPSDPTIPSIDMGGNPSFRAARCYFWGKILLWQSGVLKLAVSDEIDAVIYLGDAHYVSTWISALVARLTGKRVLFWSHGWTREESGPKAWLRALFYRLAHGLLLYGNFARGIAVEKGFDPKKVYVVFNSLDYNVQRAIREDPDAKAAARVQRRTLSVVPGAPLIVCTARLTATCRFELLLDALEMLRSRGRTINAVLVGGGPERDRLETDSTRRGLPVRFFGPCFDEQMLGVILMAADLTVSPGKVGLTAVHSLAYGIPVITHDNPQAQGPEFEAIAPGVTGDLFRWNDSASLAEVVERWLKGGDKAGNSRRTQCIEVIERHYNPMFQREVIEAALTGLPADEGIGE